MKPRKVIITLEVESDISIKDLRSKGWWLDALNSLGNLRIIQAQANVIEEGKKK